MLFLSRQVFNVVDPISGKIIGKKTRSKVHRDGSWHRAVNAFVVRKNSKSEFEILVQERSKLVDLAQLKFDQSLATQVLIEDKDDTKKALIRGLREELGIDENDTYILS